MVVLTTQAERTVNPGATYNFETRTWCNTGDSNNPTDPYYKSDWGWNGTFPNYTLSCTDV